MAQHHDAAHRSTPREADGRFDPELAHAAARMYYLDGSTQAQIAGALHVSRPTVSRLLSEARRIGLVHIEIRHPSTLAAQAQDEAGGLAEALGVREVRVASGDQQDRLGTGLRDQVGDVLGAVGLRPGDGLLISSGRTTYELARAGVPAPPGLQIAPAVAGMAEPEAYYQTNEIVRLLAEHAQGLPHFLFAPALPTPAMHRTLHEDPDFQAVTRLWDEARAAVVGVGGPTSSRTSISRHVPARGQELRTAVGDVCMNFFDVDGAPVEFTGSDRMVRASVAQLQRIPTTVAVAVGTGKVSSIIAAARTGMITHLVTDGPTAAALAERVGDGGRTGRAGRTGQR